MDGLQTWYIALGTQVVVLRYYQGCSNDYLELTLTFFIARSFCFLMVLCGKMLAHKISWKLMKILA